MNIYQKIQNKERKQYAVLIDPDKYSAGKLEETIQQAVDAGVDFLFAGGSLLTRDAFSETIKMMKAVSDIPVVIFPGSVLQIDPLADAILLLSLISGRNPDLLIGKHVMAAPYLQASKLEILSTGYMLIGSNTVTTAEYISNTSPIPAEKDEIAVCTAIAGEMLGLKLIYLDAGSGAGQPVSPSMIKQVKKSIKIPLIVGGGIRSAEQAKESCKAGADLIVTGNVIEENSSLIGEIADAVHSS